MKNSKCCIISAVGKDSLHKSWISGRSGKYDLHLMIYDQSGEKFYNDTGYLYAGTGQKYTLLHNYLRDNEYILEKYDYFYIPDDDILIDELNITRIFDYMQKYQLDIAQPAIWNYYFTFPITFKHPGTILRFTNFVEMMQPCFSKKAIKKVRFTFNETISSWGIDFHWGKIMDFKKQNIAIIDDVVSFHTRPVGYTQPRAEYTLELNAYLEKYQLTQDIFEIGRIAI